MDKIAQYQSFIKKIQKKYNNYHPDYDEFETQVIADDDQGFYYLMRIGWDDDRRIHACLFHVDIKNGKIWIQQDGTEDGVAVQLMEMGVPKSDIVIGFHVPFERKLTDEFAVS